METPHIGIHEQVLRQIARHFGSHFFRDQVVRGVNRQLDEIERRRIALGVDDPNESDRFPRRRKEGVNVAFLGAPQIPEINVVGAVVFARLVPQCDDLPTQDGPVVEKVLDQVAGLDGIRQIRSRRGRHLVGRKRNVRNGQPQGDKRKQEERPLGSHDHLGNEVG